MTNLESIFFGIFLILVARSLLKKGSSWGGEADVPQTISVIPKSWYTRSPEYHELIRTIVGWIFIGAGPIIVVVGVTKLWFSRHI